MSTKLRAACVIKLCHEEWTQTKKSSTLINANIFTDAS